MGRLASPPPRVQALGSRAPMATDRTVAAPRRDDAPWRAWYKTARWRKLRQAVLLRDNYTCQRTGRICGGRYPAPDSPTVNHKRPHRGDEALFWDPANLETVTKAIHDGLIQKEEQASRAHAGVWT